MPINYDYYRDLENAYRDKNSLMFKKLKIVTEFLPKGKKFLDIGCGTGELLNRINNRYCKLVGIDIDKNSVKFATQKIKYRKNISIIQSSLKDFKGKNFDVCVALDFLEHLDNPRLALNKIYKLLKEGGKVIFTFPNFYDKFFIFLNTKIIKKQYEHKVSYSFFGWNNIIKSAGFKVKYVRSIDFPILHFDILARKFYFFGMCLLFICEK